VVMQGARARHALRKCRENARVSAATAIRAGLADRRHACDGEVSRRSGGVGCHPVRLMSRRFEVGPLLIAIAAVVLFVALFLRWYGNDNAWHVFEITDLLLAGLAVACLVIAAALVVGDLGGLDQRPLPWLAGAVIVIVAVELLNPPPTAAVTRLGTGAWMAFAAACVMLVGAVLTVARVSFAVAVEGRDLRRRVAAVDHRPPPTETGAPVSRTTEPLLGRREQPEEEDG
jgi:hypothetical protein